MPQLTGVELGPITKQPISIPIPQQPTPKATNVRLCVNGTQTGLAPIGQNPTFTSVTLKSGDVVVLQAIQTVNSVTTYGQFSNELSVDACTSVGSNQNAATPTLSLSNLGDQTFTGTVSSDGGHAAKFVRLCVVHNPIAGAKSDARQELVVPVDGNGNFTATLPVPLKPGEKVKAQAIVTGQSPYPRSYGLVSAPVKAGLRYSGLFGSFIAGEEQSGYSSSNISTNAFVSAYIRSAYIWNHGKSGWALSGRVRLLGAPAQTAPNIITTLASPTGEITEGNLSTVGEVIDYSIGPEWQLSQHDFANGQTSRFSLIAGIGETTPLTTANPTFFAAPLYQSVDCTNFLAINPGLTPGDGVSNSCVKNSLNNTPYTDLAYTQQKRSNFLFKWGVGARFTHIYPPRGDGGVPYAGMLDLTLGQDQSVTGGRTQGVVFRMDAQYPIPFQALSFLYVYGSSSIRLGGNQNDLTVNLGALPGSAPMLPNASVLELSTQQPNKDFYRIGVGVNVLDVFSSWFKSTPTPAPATK